MVLSGGPDLLVDYENHPESETTDGNWKRRLDCVPDHEDRMIIGGQVIDWCIEQHAIMNPAYFD